MVLFDDLENDSLGTAQRIYRFLGVDPTFAPRVLRYNESRFPLSIGFQYWLARDMDRAQKVQKIGAVKHRLFRTNLKLGRFLSRPFRPDTRRRLVAAYRDDIARTTALINRPLDHWLTNDGTAV